MPTTYQRGSRVTVRNRGATWPGTVREVVGCPWGPRYSVAIDGCRTPVEVSAAYLEAPEAEEAEKNNPAP